MTTTSPEGATEECTPLPAFAPPARREVKALAQTLSTLRDGDHASAYLRSKRYGTHRVVGPLSIHAAHAGLLLVGSPVSTATQPVSDLLDITRVSDPGAALAALPTGVAVPAADLAHGDLVCGHFHLDAYGPFAVLGRAVALGANSLVLGGWFLASRGAPGVRLVRAERLAPETVPGLAALPTPGVADIVVSDR